MTALIFIYIIFRTSRNRGLVGRALIVTASSSLGRVVDSLPAPVNWFGGQSDKPDKTDLLATYFYDKSLHAVSIVHSANVALNNSFRRIFNCCWRESLKMLLFYCGVLPIVHNVDEHRILFYKKLKCHSSALLRVLAKTCYPEILSIANKYNVHCLDVSVGQVRRCVWQVFADSVM